MKGSLGEMYFKCGLKVEKICERTNDIVYGIPHSWCRDAENTRAKRKLHSRNSEKISRGGMQAWEDLRGPKGPYPPPKLPPNNFQDKLSGVSGMQENLIAAGSLPRIQPRELTAFPQTL